MAETQSFRIKYDGEALADHTIDVNDLAPSLLALADLLREANRIANHDAAKISIKVKATEAGCFQIQILAVQDILHEAVKVLAGENVNAVSNLTSLLWWGTATATTAGTALFAVIKRLKGKKPIKAVQHGEFVEIETDSGTTTISKLEWELLQSPVARGAIYQLLKPLEKPGIETIAFENEQNQKEIVVKSDVQYFLPPPALQEPLPEIPARETYVHIVQSWFKGGNKWKFSEGAGNEWSAEIKDNDFIEKLLKGEDSISGSDLLKVRVQQRQYRSGSQIQSEYEITKVIEHQKGYTQMRLPE